VIASLILGKLFDRIGLPIVLVAVFLSALFSPFVFLGSFFVALLGSLPPFGVRQGKIHH
jgi:hypothetical protein